MPFRVHTKKPVLERIESLEQAIVKAREYLETGKHAKWSGFRPLFVYKLKDGKELPPMLACSDQRRCDVFDGSLNECYFYTLVLPLFCPISL
jgi:hypothetical protein